MKRLLRRRMRRHTRALDIRALVYCALAGACFSGTPEAIGRIHSLYDAGPPTAPYSPAQWGWASLVTNPTNVAPVLNDAQSGLNAWQIADTVNANPVYSQCFDALCLATGNNSQNALENGWRFSANARYVDDFGTSAPSMGLEVWLNSRGYYVVFGLTASQDLRATLWDGTFRSVTLTSGGQGTSDYHDFALEFNPQTQLVSFEVDGTTRGTMRGYQQSHPNSFLWGEVWGTGAGLGSMNFNRVALEIMEPDTGLPGDFNNDGSVDAADYTAWRDLLGRSTTVADANGNGKADHGDYSIWRAGYGDGHGAAAVVAVEGVVPVPEPTGIALIGSLAPGILLGCRRRRA
jgi:hypothetical protein